MINKMDILSLSRILLILIINFCLLAESQLVNHNRDLFEVFNPIYNFDVSSASLSNNLIKTLASTSRYDCAKECSLIENCVLILNQPNQCNLYNKIDKSSFISSPGSTVLLAKYIDDMTSINANLVNHWPFNNNLDDIVGGAHMTNGINYVFTNDRLNWPLSSIFLNNGYLQVPDGVYFSGDFTITVWIKIGTHRYCSRFIDFGGTNHLDNICFGLSAQSNIGEIWFATFNNGAYTGSYAKISSTIRLKPNVWQHLALTLSGTMGTYYINGVSVFQTATISPRKIVRTGNYFGKSNWLEANSNVMAEFDDLKFFNRSLSQFELLKVLNSYY